MSEKKVGYDFKNFEKDTLTKPRDMAWENWWKMEKVGDKVQGYIADVFYRAAEGQYKAQRGITLKQEDGTFVNVAIKRLPFILNKTNNLHIGDPLTVVFDSELPATTKGFSKTKVMAFYGAELPETKGEKTVSYLDDEDRIAQGAKPDDAANAEFDAMGDADKDAPPFLSSK